MYVYIHIYIYQYICILNHAISSKQICDGAMAARPLRCLQALGEPSGHRLGILRSGTSQWVGSPESPGSLASWKAGWPHIQSHGWSSFFRNCHNLMSLVLRRIAFLLRFKTTFEKFTIELSQAGAALVKGPKQLRKLQKHTILVSENGAYFENDNFGERNKINHKILEYPILWSAQDKNAQEKSINQDKNTKTSTLLMICPCDVSYPFFNHHFLIGMSENTYPLIHHISDIFQQQKDDWPFPQDRTVAIVAIVCGEWPNQITISIVARQNEQLIFEFPTFWLESLYIMKHPINGPFCYSYVR